MEDIAAAESPCLIRLPTTKSSYSKRIPGFAKLVPLQGQDTIQISPSNMPPYTTTATITNHPSTEDHHPPHLQIRRRIKRKHSLSILIRQTRAQHPLRQLLPPLILGALIKYIRAEVPVGLSLVDGVPLVLSLEVGAAEVMTVAAGDEIELRRPVRAESALVRVPVEAAGRFGVAGGFEFIDAFRGGAFVSAS